MCADASGGGAILMPRGLTHAEPLGDFMPGTYEKQGLSRIGEDTAVVLPEGMLHPFA